MTDLPIDGAAVAGTSDLDAPRNGDSTSQEPFCEAMDHLIDLLAPSGRTSPDETRADFEEASSWFTQADQSAPPAIADDVATYASAYAEYVEYLREVGFDLDRVFGTDEGRQLATHRGQP